MVATPAWRRLGRMVAATRKPNESRNSYNKYTSHIREFMTVEP